MFKLNLDKIEKTSPPTKLISRKKILSMGIPSSTFEDWKRNKGLPILKIGSSVYLTENDWNNWVEEKKIVNYS